MAGTDGLNRRICCVCQEPNHTPSVVQPTVYVSVRMRLAPLIRIREDSGSSIAIALIALDWVWMRWKQVISHIAVWRVAERRQLQTWSWVTVQQGIWQAILTILVLAAAFLQRKYLHTYIHYITLTDILISIYCSLTNKCTFIKLGKV